jgi:hypothetical protein
MILEGKRIDLERGLKSKLKKALESQSDLGGQLYQLPFLPLIGKPLCVSS